MREPVKKFCYGFTWCMTLALLFLIFTKMTKQCLAPTPYFLCVANKHCAYLSKNTLDNYIVDILPFIGEGGRCVSRNDY
jgi:hypothetical protein